MDNKTTMHFVKQRFEDLYLCHCGYQSCDPLHFYGPAVRPNYLLHFVLDGRGIFQSNGNTYQVEKGQGFLITPDTSTFYQADDEAPWTYLWIGFNGKAVPRLLQALELSANNPIVRSPRGDELKSLVFSMMEIQGASVQREFCIESLLYQFFNILLLDIEPVLPAGKARENEYVQAAAQYIQNCFSEGITVEDIAAHVGIDRSYLYTLFRKELGTGPQQYLQNFRLSRAADFLIHTRHAVNVIALSCGYEDPLNFSKSFKKKYGMSPTDYRRQYNPDL